MYLSFIILPKHIIIDSHPFVIDKQLRHSIGCQDEMLPNSRCVYFHKLTQTIDGSLSVSLIEKNDMKKILNEIIALRY